MAAHLSGKFPFFGKRGGYFSIEDRLASLERENGDVRARKGKNVGNSR